MRALLALALVLLLTAPGAGQQPTFRSGTRLVPVLTTVTDSSGRLVPDLEKADFTVLDNGKPQEIVVFENSVQPFTAVVMLDFSASMTLHLELLNVPPTLGTPYDHKRHPHRLEPATDLDLEPESVSRASR